MKHCPGCGTGFEGRVWLCPGCGYAPGCIKGFPAFNPEFAASDQAGFRAEYFTTLAELEGQNFWFRARNRLIVWALGRHFCDARSFLEIGCGTGFVLSGIAAERPTLTLSASEIHTAGLQFAAKRVPKAEFFQMDARRIPFADEFDVIGAFDVLEHIEEDTDVLAGMHRAVRPGGGIVVTVPQHPILWSAQDKHAGHVRRYTRAELRRKFERAGFADVKATSFVSLLLPILAMARLAKRKRRAQFDLFDELRLGGAANTVLEKALDLERSLIQFGISFPFGGSLLMLGRKAMPGR